MSGAGAPDARVDGSGLRVGVVAAQLARPRSWTGWSRGALADVCELRRRGADASCGSPASFELPVVAGPARAPTLRRGGRARRRDPRRHAALRLRLPRGHRRADPGRAGQRRAGRLRRAHLRRRGSRRWTAPACRARRRTRAATPPWPPSPPRVTLRDAGSHGVPTTVAERFVDAFADGTGPRCSTFMPEVDFRGMTSRPSGSAPSGRASSTTCSSSWLDEHDVVDHGARRRP